MERGVGVGSTAAAAVSPPEADIAIYLCRDPVDFRKGINGLSVLVGSTLQCDPFSRNLFCFVNKRRNQIKVLYWQRTGFCLWLKRLEEERFKWPFHLEGPVVELDALADDPQIVHNGILFEREHPTAGTIRQCLPAARFSGTPTEPGAIAPLEGEHTAEILTELGYGDDSIAQLRAADVIGDRS